MEYPGRSRERPGRPSVISEVITYIIKVSIPPAKSAYVGVFEAEALSAGRLADAMRGTIGLDPALAYEAPWLVANGHLQTTPARGRSSASSFGRSTRRLPIPSVGSASPGTSDRAVRYAPIDILSRRPMPAWPMAEFGLNVSRIEGYA